MNRRTFLKPSAGAVAAAAMAAPGAPAGEFTGKIKKAVKFNMIRVDATPLEKLRMLKELGFDGVEPKFDEQVEPEELLAASRETGVEIHGVVLGRADDIPAAVDRAKFYGATSVLVVAGRVDENNYYAANYETTQAKIRAALPHAESQQILVLVENVWNNFLLSPLEMARYLDELDSEWAGAYFDIGNVVRFGWPEHWIAALGPRVKKLDVKEYDRQKQLNQGLWKGFDSKIGDGSVDWPAVRKELTGIGYSGWATAEVSGGDRERLADIAARMNNVLGL